ncbi:16S rRNA (cytosine(1402)-N(4))-methyltransferase RsmH [Myxococcota bacterium]|nr:16S rRNA (cytosine(1402)-N(4))-methyltransferase RsmH [Myxococcota bacterium]
MDHPPFHHQSVLLDATVELLDLRPGGTWLDGTLGGGGHAERILQGTAPDGLLLGIDRDPQALAAAGRRLSAYGDRFRAVRGAFGDMAALVGDRAPFDGILLDLGVSSPQLDQGARGFSLQHDGPVDMRMDPEHGQPVAALLDGLDEAGLARILHELGEEPRARRIARAVLAGRPWTSTLALADCVARASGYHGSRVHPATRTFQALRMAVNDELGQLDRALRDAPDLLAPGGRLAVISFHSLEDRMVKHRFRELSGVGAPTDAYGAPLAPPAFELVTRKGLTGAEADPANPRARSARLRVLRRLPA